MQIEEKLEKLEKQMDVITSPRGTYYGAGYTGEASDEIDLRELWDVLWSGKWFIIAVTFVFAVGAVLYALSLPNIYRSEALLAPAEENSGGGLARMAGSLGGLASLAGVNFGDGGSDKTSIAIEVLKSREFVYQFIRENDMLVPLMAAKGWDRSSGKLLLDPNVYNEQRKEWVREVKPPQLVAPSLQEAYRAFSESLSVTEDKETGFVTVAFDFYSPERAKNWVDRLVARINSEIKHRDVQEANRSVQYLTKQLEKTPVADMKAVFYELIEQQSKIVMFAEVRDEYVFKTIDGAVVPELKNSPNKPLICVLGMFLGTVLSVFIVFFSCFLKKYR